MEETPSHWRYPMFPVTVQEGDALSMERTVEHCHEALDRSEADGDEAPIGPVLHWAHVLKSEQRPDGTWPVWVNARTGQAESPDVTRGPATVMVRLAEILHTTEFDECIRLADTAQNPGPNPANP